MQKKNLLLLLFPILCQAAPPSEKPQGKVNFPSNFQVEKGWDVFVFGDYLYWTANEDGLYFAQTGAGSGTTAVPPDGSIDFSGRLKKVDPDWGNGLRIGLGVAFPKEGYDLNASWTWFASDSTDSAKGSLIVLWGYPDNAAAANATYAKGKWNLDYNLVDLAWGRSSWLGEHFSMHPFFSLRGLWIDQSLTNSYDYTTTPVSVGSVKARSNFEGGGLHAGADGRFVLPMDFAIYGSVSGSLLYGKFNAGMSVQQDGLVIAKSADHFWQCVSSLQAALGLGWDRHFYKDRLHIEFHVGWEQTFWFDVNQMNHYLGMLGGGSYFNENGNLSLQGLVAGGRFDF